MKKRQKGRLLHWRSSKIIVTKEKERRKSEEKERKRRKKSNGCTLTFYNSYCWTQKVYLVITLLKIRLNIYIYIYIYIFDQYTPENIDEITDNPNYQPTILEKLNHREQKTYCRPSREPYLNTYIEKLRQEITDRTVHNRRFQRNNLSKRERLALDRHRLSKNRDITIKPADKGGATVILNTTDYLQEAKRQLDNDTYYMRIEEDCTSGHEQTINHCIDDLVRNGEIQHDVAKLLKPAQSRTPIFYMLPKIHKINHPGRPVISSVNSHTEKISAYVDEFLKPIAERLPSYIRDTTDFIQRIKFLGKLPVECYLVTLDVSSLYTNIDIDEGLTVVQEEVIKTNRVKPSPQTLTCLLEKVLRLNNFTFNNEHFIQIRGTAMGTRAAPNFANVWEDSKKTLYTKQSGPTTL